MLFIRFEVYLIRSLIVNKYMKSVNIIKKRVISENTVDSKTKIWFPVGKINCSCNWLEGILSGKILLLLLSFGISMLLYAGKFLLDNYL